ncbi:MAG: glycoside hydrolase family 2 TIM barrel-domain containing protein, partial [Prevotella sp.]
MIRRILISACAIVSLGAMAQTRTTLTLSDGWSFSRDNASWTDVRVPHDWAIAGPFDKKWDLQFVAIEQNGETEKTEKSGRSGALPWIGEGHYRTNVKLPKGYSRAVLMIDGAMSQPTVTINGKKAGFWAYGYNAFNIDATDYLKFDGSDNDIVIDLKNVEESSRWYPGGGLYRPVRLLLTGKCQFEPWETFVRTISADASKAVVSVSAKLLDLPKGSSVIAEILDANGTKVAHAVCAPKNGEISIPTLSVSNPKLWSPESPYLYTLRLTANTGNNKVLDEEVTRFGIRTISVSKEGGFQLNGITRKIKGVCLHHDLGPLGAAESKAALIRQIKTMKEMGCDAIRTAHNMPSTLQMELCDSLGMMVMAESFDMWIYPKCKNGYATFFKEWADKDI